VAQLIEHLDVGVVRANLAEIDDGLRDAHGRSPGGRPAPRVLAAIKYLPDDQLAVLAQAGVTLVGENRAQQLNEREDAYGPLFEWHFIGQLQSRKVAAIAPRVVMIHSLASRSALAALERARDTAHPQLRLLVEVNISGEQGKAGIDPRELGSYLDDAPLPVVGLMTMPPFSTDAQSSRPYFAALRELADRHSLEHLSMGTSQDWRVAAEEGATFVRIGTSLFVPRDGDAHSSG
jgi:uncharacterized pyridoxal phosphate-containing UPF0001 family protein